MKEKEVHDATGALKVIKLVIDDDDTTPLFPTNLGYGAQKGLSVVNTTQKILVLLILIFFGEEKNIEFFRGVFFRKHVSNKESSDPFSKKEMTPFRFAKQTYESLFFLELIWRYFQHEVRNEEVGI